MWIVGSGLGDVNARGSGLVLPHGQNWSNAQMFNCLCGAKTAVINILPTYIDCDNMHFDLFDYQSYDIINGTLHSCVRFALDETIYNMPDVGMCKLEGNGYFKPRPYFPLALVSLAMVPSRMLLSTCATT